MMKLLLALICACTIAQAAITPFNLLNEEWEYFKLEHKKTYTNAEEERFRFQVFSQNRHNILEHNKDYARGKHTFKMAPNKYSDMLHYEFVAVMNGLHKNYNQSLAAGQASTFIPFTNIDLPEKVDWRNEGAVTKVKDQGQCGSCWAFGTTGCLEGQHFRKTGKLVSLSEQNLVDCSGKYGNQGCNGGLPSWAYTYIKDNGGIDTEKSYPYEAQDDTCKYNPQNIGATDVGFKSIPVDEEALKQAVAAIGPISVAIDASQPSFMQYSQGVYVDDDCSDKELDHAVLAVGYGVDEQTGLEYWLVKNSWGDSWGEAGYIRMARNKNNMCGIATMANYPLV